MMCFRVCRSSRPPSWYCSPIHVLILVSTLALAGLLLAAEPPVQPSGYQLAEVPADAPIMLGTSRAQAARQFHPKLHASLENLSAAHARLAPDPASASGLSPAHLEEGRVLVEIRFSPGARPKQELIALDATIRHQLAAGVIEAWVGIDRLVQLADLPDVVRVWPAPLVQLQTGSVTSAGVSAGNAGLWHAAALAGEGVTIAIIDSFNDTSNDINGLQSSGDWPPDARLSTVKIGAGSFGENGISHGNAVLEIAYDVAPGADYIAYDTRFVSDWIEAINLAVDAGADIISASLGAPLNGIGDGSALPGSVAEAVEAAAAAGVIYINAAGNSRERHWGGLFKSSTGANSNLHAWDGFEMEVNFFGPGNGEALCLSDGTSIRGELFWDDWDDVNHNYDLILLEFFENSGWQEVDRSDDLQIGLPGQQPQEFLQVDADSGDANTCGGTGSGIYGWSVLNSGATTARNLQFFTNHRLDRRVEARSLGFPADSPSAISVAALNVSNSAHEFYSSEGPILAPGGGPPTGNEHPKPDLASFARVATVTSGSFAGTSASAPHVAGMAALLIERHPTMTSSELFGRLQLISSIGSNDLGDAGHDFQHGYGRLRFQAENMLVINQQPTNTEINDIIAPPVEVEIFDDEGISVISGPTVEIDGGLGNDPSGGAATLNGSASRQVVDGLSVFDNLSINAGGNGYTLVFNSIGAGSIESNSFDVIDTTPVALSFSVQPEDTQINNFITPSIVVQVLDASGGLVTDDNTTQVELILVAGPAAAGLTGGGPVVVNNGEAIFNTVSIDEVGSGYQLQAADLSDVLAPDTSVDFNIIAGNPASLAFLSQPGDAEVDEVIDPPVQVEVRDAFGNRVDWDNATEIILTLSGDMAGAVLSGDGPVIVNDGLAVFDALSINQAGTGYQLNASDGNEQLDPAVSSPFDIVADKIFRDRFEGASQ